MKLARLSLQIWHPYGITFKVYHKQAVIERFPSLSRDLPKVVVHLFSLQICLKYQTY
jgi:hypothetical protein